MDEKDFLVRMQDLLDCNQELDMKTDLLDIEEWDSLSFVKFLAMADNVYKKDLSAKAVRNANSIEDLYNLISK